MPALKRIHRLCSVRKTHVQIHVEKFDSIIYCVEYGVIDRADNASTIHWFKQIHEAFEHYGIGRALWTYKDLDYGLKDQRFEGIRETILQYL